MSVRIRLKDQNNDDLIVQAGESFNIIATFSDVSETPTTLTEADISTITLTLFAGTSVINSRDAQDVKDANDGTLDTDGTLTVALGPLDQVIVDGTLSAGDLEEHIARFVWTWNDGAVRTGIAEYVFDVEKLVSPS